MPPIQTLTALSEAAASYMRSTLSVVALTPADDSATSLVLQAKVASALRAGATRDDLLAAFAAAQECELSRHGAEASAVWADRMTRLLDGWMWEPAPTEPPPPTEPSCEP